MDSQNKPGDSWNTIINKRKKPKNKNEILIFFKKIKEELDNEFPLIKNKIKKKIDKEEIKNQNIFSLLLEDSE